MNNFYSLLSKKNDRIEFTSQGLPAQIQKKYAATASDNETQAVIGSIISQLRAYQAPYIKAEYWAIIIAVKVKADLTARILASSLQLSIYFLSG